MKSLIAALICTIMAQNSWPQDPGMKIIPKNRAEKSKFLEIKEKDAISHINTGSHLKESLKEKDFSLLVWNVYKGVKKDIFKAYPSVAERYDFLVLQEAYTIPEMLKMFSGTTHQYTLAGSFIYKPQMVTTGVATGSHIKPVKEIPVQSMHKEPIVDATQMCLITEYKIAGSNNTLMIVNIHAITFVSSEKLFEQFDTLMKRTQKHKGPLIFAGDFNTWDEAKTKYLMRIVKSLKLNEIQYAPDLRRTFRDYPLDHLFYRGLKLNHARVLQMNQYSDHNPIEAGFSLL